MPPAKTKSPRVPGKHQVRSVDFSELADRMLDDRTMNFQQPPRSRVAEMAEDRLLLDEADLQETIIDGRRAKEEERASGHRARTAQRSAEEVEAQLRVTKAVAELQKIRHDQEEGEQEPLSYDELYSQNYRMLLDAGYSKKNAAKVARRSASTTYRELTGGKTGQALILPPGTREPDEEEDDLDPLRMVGKLLLKQMVENMVKGTGPGNGAQPKEKTRLEQLLEMKMENDLENMLNPAPPVDPLHAIQEQAKTLGALRALFVDPTPREVRQPETRLVDLTAIGIPANVPGEYIMPILGAKMADDTERYRIDAANKVELAKATRWASALNAIAKTGKTIGVGALQAMRGGGAAEEEEEEEPNELGEGGPEERPAAHVELDNCPHCGKLTLPKDPPVGVTVHCWECGKTSTAVAPGARPPAQPPPAKTTVPPVAKAPGPQRPGVSRIAELRERVAQPQDERQRSQEEEEEGAGIDEREMSVLATP